MFLHAICCCIPCGCIGEEAIQVACCCNPGRASEDPVERKKKNAKQVSDSTQKAEKVPQAEPK